MPKFGARSENKLRSLDPQLRGICRELIRLYDVTVVTTFRGEVEQNAAFEAGSSKLKFPNSLHNVYPARAGDLAPWRDGGIPWDDTQSFVFMAGLFLGIALERGVNVRWGGAWDTPLTDALARPSWDPGHFE